MYQTIAKSIFGELPYKPLVPNYTLFTLCSHLPHSYSMGAKVKGLAPLITITCAATIICLGMLAASVCA